MRFELSVVDAVVPEPLRCPLSEHVRQYGQNRRHKSHGLDNGGVAECNSRSNSPLQELHGSKQVHGQQRDLRSHGSCHWRSCLRKFHQTGHENNYKKKSISGNANWNRTLIPSIFECLYLFVLMSQSLKCNNFGHLWDPAKSCKYLNQCFYGIPILDLLSFPKPNSVHVSESVFFSLFSFLGLWFPFPTAHCFSLFLFLLHICASCFCLFVSFSIFETPTVASHFSPLFLWVRLWNVDLEMLIGGKEKKRKKETKSLDF